MYHPLLLCIVSIIFSCSSADTPMLSKASRVPQSGQICVLGYFLERAGTSPYCAPQSGQVRSVVVLSFILNYPPAFFMCPHKHTLVKHKSLVPIKASPQVKLAWNTDRSVLMHNVCKSGDRSPFACAYTLASQLDILLVIEVWITLVAVKCKLICWVHFPYCYRNTATLILLNGEIRTCQTAFKKQFIAFQISRCKYCRSRTSSFHLSNIQVTAVCNVVSFQKYQLLLPPQDRQSGRVGLRLIVSSRSAVSESRVAVKVSC